LNTHTSSGTGTRIEVDKAKALTTVKLQSEPPRYGNYCFYGNITKQKGTQIFPDSATS